MKVFLTGGTGFIGQPLTQALRERGWDVIALVRKPGSAEAKTIQAMGAQLVCGDVTDRASMRDAMTGVDIVIHNAGWYEFGITKAAQPKMRAINVQGTENTLGLAIELGIPKIIYVSTILAFGPTGDVVADETFQRQKPPATCYEQTKAEAHALAVQHQQRGAPVVVVCPAGVIGPGDHSAVGYFVRMYVRGWMPPVLFAANGRGARVYVDDVAEAMALAVERGQAGQTYILTNGNMRHRDMFELWTQTPGGFKPLLWMPNPLAMVMCAVAEPFQRQLGLPMVLCREVALTAFDSWQFSATKAERELGMKFRSVEQAWLDTLEGERAIARKHKG